MTKFKVGDKIRIYGAPSSVTAWVATDFITEILFDESLIITGENGTVHIKQVRKLVKKVRREWEGRWVRNTRADGIYFSPNETRDGQLNDLLGARMTLREVKK
jgi:signal transduction protein with GAF and PtsI domain